MSLFHFRFNNFKRYRMQYSELNNYSTRAGTRRCLGLFVVILVSVDTTTSTVMQPMTDAHTRIRTRTHVAGCDELFEKQRQRELFQGKLSAHTHHKQYWARGKQRRVAPPKKIRTSYAFPEKKRPTSTITKRLRVPRPNHVRNSSIATRRGAQSLAQGSPVRLRRTSGEEHGRIAEFDDLGVCHSRQEGHRLGGWTLYV